MGYLLGLIGHWWRVFEVGKIAEAEPDVGSLRPAGSEAPKHMDLMVGNKGSLKLVEIGLAKLAAVAGKQVEY